MLLQDGIGFAFQGHKVVIELINEDTNDMTGQSKHSHNFESQASYGCMSDKICTRSLSAHHVIDGTSCLWHKCESELVRSQP